MILITLMTAMVLCFIFSIVWSKKLAVSLVTGNTNDLTKKIVFMLALYLVFCTLFTILCFQVVDSADVWIKSLWAIGNFILIETFLLYLFFLKTMQKLKMAPTIRREKFFRIYCAVLSTLIIVGLSCLVQPNLIAISIVLIIGVVKIILTLKKNSIFSKLT